MEKSFRRATGRSIFIWLAVFALLPTGCQRPVPEESDYSVGIADSAALGEKSLTLRRLRLFSDGFFVSKNIPPEDQLKGKVLFQVAGQKRATQASTQLGMGLNLAGAPRDSSVGKAGRERYVTLSADEYTLTQYSADGEPTDIPTVDIDVIILEQ